MQYHWRRQWAQWMSEVQAWRFVRLLQWFFIHGRKQETTQSSNSILEVLGDSVEQKEYVVRVQSDISYTYGIGEVIVPGVALFKESEIHLTKEELNAKLRSLGKVTLR
jgi:hypothetical protein